MNHKILLNKLKLYGVCQASLNWFALYLTNRTEKTFIDGVLSDSCIIKMWNCPGFYSWSATIIVCINDLPSCNLYSKVRMYADDSSFNVAHSDEYILENK